MSRAPIPTSFFALVVVRRGQQFLLIQEQRYGQSWSLPGGRVEPGEALIAAAVREVMEESGVPVSINGIFRVEHGVVAGGSRLRVIFSGTPVDDTPPKSVSDSESLRAQWLTLDEIRALPLRGTELAHFLAEIDGDRPLFPLDLLGRELSI